MATISSQRKARPTATPALRRPDPLLTFDLTPFYPQKSKRRRPRQKEETQTLRKRYAVVKESRKRLKFPKEKENGDHMSEKKTAIQG
jgi:hypothetical protein